ncbi:hypothetical protein IWQ60_004827 [Tieghemiomyces parasiticus]|uniref:Uncharacterized protein n=1 Tax=Tieghemiomyces parasiticus TaxID=78921 RepID=A0A9W8DZE7_9FUNG|nr:hypothetical protein IWQ60_004827 [Tieghemiomyces parasiticus]
MDLEEAAILAVDVTWYLGAASLWAVRVVDAFLTQFASALTNAPNDLFHTETLTSHDLPEYMERVVKEAKLSKKRQEYLRKYTAPGPSRTPATPTASPSPLSSSKATPPKPSRFQRMRERALVAEAKLAIQDKAEATKAGNA